jgi:hypothetical protein
MKLTKFVLCAAVAALAAPVAAQEHGAHHAASGWKELDAYHELMAASWHPAKADDLKPARAKADSLSAAAKTWAAAKVPAACDTKPIRDAIADVVTGSAKVADLAQKNVADAELKAALHDLHERFEVVEKGCKPGKSHH